MAGQETRSIPTCPRKGRISDVFHARVLSLTVDDMVSLVGMPDAVRLPAMPTELLKMPRAVARLEG